MVRVYSSITERNISFILLNNMLNRIALEFQTYMFKFGILLEFVSFHWNRWLHCHSIGWFSLLNQKDDFLDSGKSFAMLLESSFQYLKVFTSMNDSIHKLIFKSSNTESFPPFQISGQLLHEIFEFGFICIERVV